MGEINIRGRYPYKAKPRELHLKRGEVWIVSVLRFSDGVRLDIGGELRKVELADGWYVLGKGMSIPMATESECDRFLESYRLREEQRKTSK